MKINYTKTIDDLHNLYNCSAMTWEGLIESDIPIALKTCCIDKEDGEVWITTGEIMNKLCQLTGSNAYPKDLTIVSIPHFKGLALNYGARWMDDIIDNNAYRSGFDPFEDME
jgi:hypothetical protein